jgi:hypothetical protein
MPQVGMGMLGLVGLLCFAIGVAVGGIILPFMRAPVAPEAAIPKPNVEAATSRQIFVTLNPQTIYARVSASQPLSSTALSVEQYLTELEVRASQSGLRFDRVARVLPGGYEISLSFQPAVGDQAKPTTAPSTLSLTFEQGPFPGTLVLSQMRKGGVLQSNGRLFADLVQAGAKPPPLPLGQSLTRTGLFQLASNGPVVGAVVDATLVYPIQGARSKQGVNSGVPLQGQWVAAPAGQNSLKIQSIFPVGAPLGELALLVATTKAGGDCNGRAVVVDLIRMTSLEVARPVQPDTVIGEMRDGSLRISGFCGASPTGQTIATYQLLGGKLSWSQESVSTVMVADPPSPGLPATPGIPIEGWRTASPTRLVTPQGPKGALLSIACRPGGGYTLAIAGLPAPKDGAIGLVGVSSGGQTTQVAMKWKPSAQGYEATGLSNAAMPDPVLARLKANGQIKASLQGSSLAFPPSGAGQVDALMAQCQPAPKSPKG